MVRKIENLFLKSLRGILQRKVYSLRKLNLNLCHQELPKFKIIHVNVQTVSILLLLKSPSVVAVNKKSMKENKNITLSPNSRLKEKNRIARMIN